MFICWVAQLKSQHLGRLTEDRHEFKTRLDYRMSVRLAQAGSKVTILKEQINRPPKKKKLIKEHSPYWIYECSCVLSEVI